MTEHTQTTTTLNTLIATLIDSVEGYQKSAADVESPRFADMFTARAQERQQAACSMGQATAMARQIEPNLVAEDAWVERVIGCFAGLRKPAAVRRMMAR